MAEVADRDDVPEAEAAEAEDEDTEEWLAVVAVCVPVTEPDVADNEDDNEDADDDEDEAAAAPVEEADVPAQEAIVGTVTPTLFSTDSTSVYVSLSEISILHIQFLPCFIVFVRVCVCVVFFCEGMGVRRGRRRRRRLKKRAKLTVCTNC